LYHERHDSDADLLILLLVAVFLNNALYQISRRCGSRL